MKKLINVLWAIEKDLRQIANSLHGSQAHTIKTSNQFSGRYWKDE